MCNSFIFDSSTIQPDFKYTDKNHVKFYSSQKPCKLYLFVRASTYCG